MSRPIRNSQPVSIRAISRTFFVTSNAFEKNALFQSARMAGLLIDVLRTYAKAGKFVVHDFVVMPDHLHVILTVDESTAIEKAVQLIKGGFSYRARKELGYQGEVWQPGFTEVRVANKNSFLQHRTYIDQNPVKAGLADSPEKYPYGSAYLKMKKRKGN
jgi:putative transposase